MPIVRLVYLAVLIATGMFFIMYIDVLSLLMFLLVALIPFFLFIFLLIAKICTDITVDVEPSIVTRGMPTHIIINARNRSFVSASRVQMKVTYKNNFEQKEYSETICFPVSAGTHHKIKMDLLVSHCGVISVDVSKAVFYDFFRITKLNKKLDGKKQFTVIPEVQEIDASINFNTNVSFEADTFSKSKSGDDPSEIFKIRDYQGGDKLNRIHWKLSSKQDNLLVKEYSLPIDYSIVFLVELSRLENRPLTSENIDGIIETLASLSNFLQEREICHVICWTNGEADVFCESEITTEDDLYQTIGMMIQGKVCDTPLSSAKMFSESSKATRCSHLIYITADDIQNVIPLFSQYYYSKTIAQITDEPKEYTSGTGVEVVSVNSNNIEESLYKIVL